MRTLDELPFDNNLAARADGNVPPLSKSAAVVRESRTEGKRIAGQRNAVDGNFPRVLLEFAGLIDDNIVPRLRNIAAVQLAATFHDPLEVLL